MENKIRLSQLGHTWLFDLDGTVLKHNGYKTDGYDSFLGGAEQFLKNLPNKDMLVFITSRSEEYREVTESFLKEKGIRYNHIIFNAPFGERILINDKKPSGLKTGICINIRRDEWENIEIEEDNSL